MNILSNKGSGTKITHVILFIITGLYLLETIFIRGLFTNIILACITIAWSLISLILALIKKEYKLAIIDLIIFCVILALFIFLTSL